MRKESQPRLIPGWIVQAILTLLIVTLSGCLTRAAITQVSCTATSSPAPSITLALVGDVMLGRDVHPSPGTFSYLRPFLTSADLALANLESPLTNVPTQTESPYALCAPPENVKYLVDAGFDLLALSNNHNFDCGAKGLTDTQKTLTDASLGFIGPGPEPVYRSINGIQLAFLAFDATAGLDLDAAARAVRLARETGAVVVVSIHWGVEYQAGASADQKQIAERLAEAGAAIIWGHHPHVLQPAEWTHDHQTLVLYSLGNALFDQYGLDNTRRSALILAKVDSHGVQDFSFIPFLIDVRNSRIIEAGQADTQLIQQYFK